MNSAREAAAVLERLPSLAAFGLPSPSAILLQNAAKVPAQPIATRPQASTLYEAATPAPSTSTAYPQLRRGRPRLDRSTLRCAHCGSTESTQWRTSSLYVFLRDSRLSLFSFVSSRNQTPYSWNVSTMCPSLTVASGVLVLFATRVASALSAEGNARPATPSRLTRSPRATT